MNSDRFMMFSKHVQDLPPTEAARLIKGIGLCHVDLTVRTGGHVEPAKVADDLPGIAETFTSFGLTIGMISTEITDAAAPTTAAILRTARSLGVTHYKLGYWRYGQFGSLRQQRSEIKARLRDLAQLNREIGISAGFHNHSDDFFGANIADIEWVLDGIEPRDIGSYFDPCHAVVEGGSCGWKMALDLILPRITMLAVKDFRWIEGKHRYAGGRRHSMEYIPLEQGNVPWPEVISILDNSNFDGPVSFFGEYQGDHSFRDLTSPQVVEQTKLDIEYFKRAGGG